MTTLVFVKDIAMQLKKASIILYIPEKNKLTTCKGVSLDNKINKNWLRIL